MECGGRETGREKKQQPRLHVAHIHLRIMVSCVEVASTVAKRLSISQRVWQRRNANGSRQ